MGNTEWEQKLSEQIPRMRRYARALTGHTDQADDLVQDSLERAWGKRHTWQTGTNLNAWLFRIVHNQFINGVRRDKVARQYTESLPAEEPANESDTTNHLRDLERCLARLRPEYREVVLLAGLEGLSYKEITEVLDCPLGTVMSRLSRGREELRKLMSEESRQKVVRIK